MLSKRGATKWSPAWKAWWEKPAVAQTALSPRGKVFVHGELWDAISSSNDLGAGEPVVVRRVEGLRFAGRAVGCNSRCAYNRCPLMGARTSSNQRLPPNSPPVLVACVTIRIRRIVRLTRGGTDGISWRQHWIRHYYHHRGCSVPAQFDQDLWRNTSAASSFGWGAFCPLPRGRASSSCSRRWTAWCEFRCGRRRWKFRRKTSSRATT